MLFYANELTDDGRLNLHDRRARHILTVLGAQPGKTIKMGQINGPCGVGIVETVTNNSVVLRWQPEACEPDMPAVDLLLALPRPKTMKRLWAPLASLGVSRIFITNAAKVPRAYFETHWLQPANYEPLLLEGLEQSGETRLPSVHICRRLKPFLEDELDCLHPRGVRLLAHPDANNAASSVPDIDTQPLLLAVGPDGGWTEFERDLFLRHGFHLFSLGARTLRCDVACIALIAVLIHGRNLIQKLADKAAYPRFCV